MPRNIGGKTTQKRSIVGKINASLLAILLPALILLIGVSCLMAASAVSRLTEEKVAAQTALAVSSVDEFFRNKITAIRMFEENSAMQMLLTDSKTKLDMRMAAMRGSVMRTLDSAEKGMADEGVQSAWVGCLAAGCFMKANGDVTDADFASYEWAERVLSERKTLVSEPYLDTESNKVVITVVGPVLSSSGSDVVGFVGFEVNQDSLSEIMREIKIGKSGFLDVISNTNTYLYSADADVIGADVMSLPSLTDDYKDKVKSDYTGEYTYRYGINTYVSQFQRSETTGWLLISNISKSEINATRNQLILVLVLLTAVLLAVLIVTLAKRIKRLVGPLRELTADVEAFAQGDLSVEIAVDSDDEIGTLADSVRLTITNLQTIIHDISHILSEIANGNLALVVDGEYMGDFLPIKEALTRIIDALNDTLGHINQSSDLVASGSGQVSSGAQALSQGAAEQASSVEELAATINEIAAHVDTNASHAHEASTKARQTAAELENGKTQMEQMTAAMKEINQTAGEIGKIIKTIEDIAFQTNILALNAAVEAARAGDAGKGFAVVADEVRNLASKSSDASKSTSELIERSIHSVQQGTKIALETASSLSRIVESSAQSATLVHQISKASQEQSVSIAQVTVGIDQISSVVQTNSATAEESAAASEELSGQAQVLKSLVARFRLRNGMGGTGGLAPQDLEPPEGPEQMEADGGDQPFDEGKY